MKEDIGRYLDGRLFETVQLIKIIYDLATGEGRDVIAQVDGRELVFHRGEPKGAGFVRLLPAETSVTLSFPLGARLFDPGKRLKGVPGSRLRITLRGKQDVDPYVRRLVDNAYAIEG